MRSVNKVILVGNLTRDPELKQTQNGQAICTFGMATNRDWKDQGGEQHSLAEFHEITAWARRAEICHQILKKGNLVYIEGYLKTRNWIEEDTGKKRFRTEVVVDDVIKLEKRSSSEVVKEDYVPDATDEANEGEDAATAFSDHDQPIKEEKQE